MKHSLVGICLTKAWEKSSFSDFVIDSLNTNNKTVCYLNGPTQAQMTINNNDYNVTSFGKTYKHR